MSKTRGRREEAATSRVKDTLIQKQSDFANIACVPELIIH
jgi:hypothetical protein